MVREEFTLSDAFYVKLCNVCIKSFIALIHSLIKKKKKNLVTQNMILFKVEFV